MAAPEWSELPGVDGRNHSLADFKGAYVVIAFIADHCSLCRFQVQELSKIQRDYRSKEVHVVAISVGSADVSVERISTRARELGVDFTYLQDTKQECMRRHQIQCVPTILVVDKEGIIAYRGALNDDEEPIRNHYVRDALDALVKGRPVAVPETKPFGCGVRYD